MVQSESPREWPSGWPERFTTATLDDLEVEDWQRAAAVFNLLGESLAASDEERPLVFADAKELVKEGGKSLARDYFLEWWYDYLTALFAYEMLDGWISSPFHDLDQDTVRQRARDRVVGMSDAGKRKLAKRLRDKAERLREQAKKLRADGKDEAAGRAEDQARAFDQAADEVMKDVG